MKRTLEMNVREAAAKGTTLVCLTTQQIDALLNEAHRIGVTIEPPILVQDYHQQRLK